MSPIRPGALYRTDNGRPYEPTLNVGSIFPLASGVRHVDGLAVLIVSAVAAAAMTAGAALVDQDDDDDLNRRAVLLDTIADAAAAAGIAATGAVILIAHRWSWLDPAAALTIAYHAAKLLRRIVSTRRGERTTY